MKKTYHHLHSLAIMLGCICFSANIATADTVNPLYSTENWTIGHDNSSKTAEPVIDTSNGTLSLTNANWSRGYAIYTLPKPVTLSNPADKYTISYDFSISDNNSLITSTIITNKLAITTGHGAYNDPGRNGMQLGTTTITDGNFYNTQGPNTGGVYVEPIKNYVGELPINETVTLTSSVFWHAPESQFVASFTTTYQNNLAYVGYIGLGDSCTLEKIVISLDGNSVQRISNMSITAEITPTIPEPATTALAIITVCGLAARRRRK